MNNKDIRNYRRTRMQKELVIEKLREKGCRITKQRLMLLDIILEEKGAFPHEIGLLLGYLVEDVLIVFTNTVSHQMVKSAVGEAEKSHANIIRCHTSSGSALNEILENVKISQ